MLTLIVEDNKISSKLLQEVLQAEGYDTLVADDGQEALHLLERNSIDCIVSDVMMPNIDGFRLVYKVRRSDQYKNIPFIMYSAASMSAHDKEFAIRLGVNTYIQKQGNMNEIVTAIDELIKNNGGISLQTNKRDDEWVMEKYSSLLIDKLEDTISELERTKKDLKNALSKEREARLEIDQLNQSLEEKVAKRTLELQESIRELEAFSYSVSHDLRTPLRSITGYASMLEEDFNNVIDEEGKRLLGLISRNANTMGILIDDLLTFSRLGKKELLKTKINMTELFEEVSYEVSKVYKHKAEIKINELHSTRADRSLIKQVLVNLFINAIKYSSKQKNPHIEISSEDNGNEVLYYLMDNGVGFDMTFVDKLFNVFQRLHSVTEFEGTGIGLALVKRIVFKHNGKVWAKGKPNEGATFGFSLPK